jgi:hypothetical protein
MDGENPIADGEPDSLAVHPLVLSNQAVNRISDDSDQEVIINPVVRLRSWPAQDALMLGGEERWIAQLRVLR